MIIQNCEQKAEGRELPGGDVILGLSADAFERPP